jgi:hypothetical protein
MLELQIFLFEKQLAVPSAISSLIPNFSPTLQGMGIIKQARVARAVFQP